MRQLHVGGVIGRIAVGNHVFAAFRQYLKFVRARAADAARVRRHRAEVQPQAAEYAAIGVIHGLIRFLQRSEIGVERIGVFHHKFARAHHAETRAALVAEFGVDVVEIFGQLFVGIDFFADDVGDHLFAGGAEAEFVVVAVGNPQQFVAVKIPAAGLFPQVGRLDDGH